MDEGWTAKKERNEMIYGHLGLTVRVWSAYPLAEEGEQCSILSSSDYAFVAPLRYQDVPPALQRRLADSILNGITFKQRAIGVCLK
jgi:hypothetical protein